MRTTVDLPEDLLEQARRATDSKTMRETLILALEELMGGEAQTDASHE